ncbi:MAG: hypothetical protein A3J24_06215 [Deltaproteobacteria bacterium RIFCSPLOWO2_02_FULL_53_8]|nr:MAG: hypothetical protein A3J24_06215 [Deltaproteobacteria bacterium RIFCSPLOWO2_02_FULL_53_8]
MEIQIRIYYEDTDCGGVVYYANYLKYFERGRTEYLRAKGITLTDPHAGGVIFVVTKAEAAYASSCRYGELIRVDTRLVGITGVTISFEHAVWRDGADSPAVTGKVTLACVDINSRPARIPKTLRDSLDVTG